MDKDALTAWALANGWTMIAGNPSLTKPSSPKEAIVRMLLKATVVTIEVKKPAGKWEKVASEPYGKVEADPEGGPPQDWARLISSLRMLGEVEHAGQIAEEARARFAADPAALQAIDQALSAPAGVVQ